ncbi:amidohydrolase family protein [Candidatus Palauibacter soopunensis]|uniref:amidohydrolase family protein n=1 Tax=Candidatus Palauibacter soopunensis TaxID=3056739 RepID=UPI0023A094C6|nr:amidohydrolase family protein [Candidatus Palauibacter soopunensis]MDE2877352.1 amidohydrolase family protein [Candidatus Palauibacter soopunensis]
MLRAHAVTSIPAVRPAVLAIAAVLVAGCATDGGEGGAGVTAFEGATVLTGDGSVISSAVFLVQDGQFAAVGASGDVEVPDGAERVDLGGKTVMPAIVNAHLHLSSERDERIEQLRHMAYYGAGAVVSLGTETGGIGIEMRDEVIPDAARAKTADRGITMPEPGRSEAPYWIETEEEGRDAVRELAERQADIIKIWVDDRGGRYEQLPPELYGAIIDEAHGHGLMVTAHVFYLEDAKELLRAGVDVFAHGVRDLDADDELMALWAERPEVVLVPNLPGPGVALDLSWLAGTVPADQLAEMQAASVDNPAARESFGIQARNLARFAEAGIRISFGTDGNAAWAVHQEMEDMVRSGMTPGDVIVAATKTSAELMSWDDLGEIAAGKSADFIVMDANPLDDITNTRRIDAVYLRGDMVDRDGISAHMLGGGTE